MYVYIYMYVCMYVCMCVCICIYIYIYIYIFRTCDLGAQQDVCLKRKCVSEVLGASVKFPHDLVQGALDETTHGQMQH